MNLFYVYKLSKNFVSCHVKRLRIQQNIPWNLSFKTYFNPSTSGDFSCFSTNLINTLMSVAAMLMLVAAMFIYSKQDIVSKNIRNNTSAQSANEKPLEKWEYLGLEPITNIWNKVFKNGSSEIVEGCLMLVFTAFGCLMYFLQYLDMQFITLGKMFSKVISNGYSEKLKQPHKLSTFLDPKKCQIKNEKIVRNCF